MPTSSENTVAIQLENVRKRYRLGAGYDSLATLAGSWGRRLLGRNGRTGDADHFWALNGISFEVHRGEAVGLVGPNGAGKTTTLKLLSRVTRPTSGRIQVFGRFSSLIELGAGFHPDLTGRENVYLNGVILGLTRREVQERFDQIVAFSELEEFMDMPVKRYSSGMYARLGFAVAAHVDPDIMLVDEVLAVGDASFQQKCYDFIHRFVKSGKTTVFVSHNLYVIEQLCDRVIWLERGQIRMSGSPAEVLPAYLDSQDRRLLQSQAEDIESLDDRLHIQSVTFADASGRPTDTFHAGEDVVVEIRYRASRPIESPHFVVAVADVQGGTPLFHASMLVDNRAPAVLSGEGVVRCRFKAAPLRPRPYQVMGEVWGADRARLLVNWQRFGVFHIVDERLHQMGKGGIRHFRADAPVTVPYEWEVL